MDSIKKNIIYGLLVWLIPFVISFAFYSLNGDLIIDKIFFKTIMIIAGTTTGAILVVKYFKNVERNFVKEGMLLGVTWLAINWGLDLVILIPMSKMTILSYFMEIGLRYFGFLILSIAIGYSLTLKLTNNEKN